MNDRPPWILADDDEDFDAFVRRWKLEPISPRQLTRANWRIELSGEVRPRVFITDEAAEHFERLDEVLQLLYRLKAHVLMPVELTAPKKRRRSAADG